MNDLKDTILKEIRDGKVLMKPRIYFTLKIAAIGVLSLLIVLITVFIFNFIFFSIRLSGNNQLLGFGSSGIGAFLKFFPWPLLVLDVLLTIALQSLIRRFRFGYHIPIAYVVLTPIIGAFLIGFALDRGTSLNDRLHASRGHLPPPFFRLYDRAQKPPPPGSGLCRCTILAIEGNVLTLEDTRSSTTTLTVILPMNDRHATTSNLAVGDVVFIAGKEMGGVIEAFGVRKESDAPHFRLKEKL